MKIAYFDCFAGLAGDMILGALFDAGLDQTAWNKELAKLKLSGYEVEIKKVEKQHISATQIKVKIKESHRHRKLSDIISLIDNSLLDSEVKQKSKQIFDRLASAEAKVHGKSKEEVHFHEVGAIDAILDIVGAVVGLRLLQIEAIYGSALPLTSGFTKTEHGTFPVPAPATLELLAGWPTQTRAIEGEIVTPTGAAILTTLGKPSPSLEFIPEKTGYGAGQKDFKEFPNVLRVTIGEKVPHHEQDEVAVLETNLDNTEPQLLGYLLEKLMSSGAKDAFFTPVVMKKNRPGILLTVLAESSDASRLSEIIFRETYTSGIRMRRESRVKLPRRTVEIQTDLGKARVKLIGEDSSLEVLPEFEDCKIIAQQHNLPLKIVYERIKAAYLNQKEKK
jgi:hypothetical protein